MNYAREADLVVHEWFDGWLRWGKSNKYGRQMVIGLGAYLNPPASTLAQVRRPREPQGKHRADGVSLFSYASLSAARPKLDEGSSTGVPISGTDSAPNSGLFLAYGVQGDAGVFLESAKVPPMDWIEESTRGLVAGFVKAADMAALDGVKVGLKSRGWFRRTGHVVSDGNGVFGFANLKPGRYQVWIDERTGDKAVAGVEVAAGHVAQRATSTAMRALQTGVAWNTVALHCWFAAVGKIMT